MTASRAGAGRSPRRLSAEVILRWAAVAVAVAAVIDPSVSLPLWRRPAVRVIEHGNVPSSGTIARVRAAGFPVNDGQREAAVVLVGGRMPSTLPLSQGRPIFALAPEQVAPDVSIVRVDAPHTRVPGQAARVQVTISARGAASTETRILLEDGGLAIAEARHAWSGPSETWNATLDYLPPGAGSVRLRVRAVPAAGETQVDDNVADLLVPPVRGPIRTLVVESGVTWPASFVRRAIEGEPAFSVAAIQRATRGIATRAGTPPAALTRDALAPFEVAVLGRPDDLAAGEIDAIRWFVEERGGVAVFVPDQKPAGRYVNLIGTRAFESRVLADPVTLSGADGLSAAELLVPAALPDQASVLASASGDPVVFSARRGMGAILFCGALDAWRYRAQGPDGFARFWRSAIATQAAAVPPRVDVTAWPTVARPGEVTHIVARLRATELPTGASAVDVPAASARIVGPGKVDVPLRLWPTPEPGVYRGDWRAAAPDGDYAVDVAMGEWRGGAVVAVATDALHGANDDLEDLANAAQATGGRVFPSENALVEGLDAQLPRRRVSTPSHPLRSAWWAVVFATLLTGEWTLRRRRGAS